LPRILSIDYGLKRTGLAVTDPLQIIATGLTTVESKQLIPFLKDYFAREEVELIIIGDPKNWDDTDTHATPLVEKIIKQLEKNFPNIPIKKVDERYTSKMAKDAMLEMGLKKMQRRNKKLVDEIAATILLAGVSPAILDFRLQISDAIDGLIILNSLFKSEI
jgi:putative Holliday junction resolvase